MIAEHTMVLIICGGGGTRLWPRSRQKTPKQFLKLLGKETLLQKTVFRAEKIVPPSRIFFVTGRDYVGPILKNCPQIPPANIIVEPDKKHTAIAMVLGAAKIKNFNPNAVIINLWSDQLIENNENFSKDLKKAAQLAIEKKAIISLGIEPTFPHTGLGYIKTGEKISDRVFRVEKFLEKPSLSLAKRFLKEGNHYWNLGTYTWQIKTFLSELNKVNPSFSAWAKEIEKAIGKANEWEKISAVYQKVTPISIDEALAEKTKNMLMVAATFDWYDVGDWQTVWDKSPKDKDKNVILGITGPRPVLVESKNCLIHHHKKLIAAYGLENLVVVDTKDALLICPKEKSQKVKELVQIIKEKKSRYA